MAMPPVVALKIRRFTRDDAHKRIINRPLERAAVEHQRGRIVEDVGNLLSKMCEILVAAPATPSSFRDREYVMQSRSQPNLSMHIQNHAPVDRAGMDAREHVVDVLKPLGGDSGTCLTSTGEFKYPAGRAGCRRSSPAA